MILEYLLLNKEQKENIESYNKNISNFGSTHNLKPKEITICIKEFDAAEYWAIKYECPKNDESSAIYLSLLNDEFVSNYSPTVLINESAEYFNKVLYPLVNKFERYLRKFLFLKVVQCDVNKFGHIIRELESKDFGEIYNILFVDAEFRKSASNVIKNSLTRSELLETLQNLNENTAWDILVSKGVLDIIKDNFDAMKDYRNDVMHAHNISYDTYKKAKKLFSDANAQLEIEIQKIIEFAPILPKPVEYNNTLYEKLLLANEMASKLGNGMIHALQIWSNISSTVFTPERLETLEKLLIAFSNLEQSENDNSSEIVDDSDKETKETDDNEE